MALTKEQKKEIFDNIKVGNIFECTWGYSMTLVDFYQVVEKKGTATVKLRKLNNKNQTGDGFQGTTIAKKDDFYDDKILTKRLNKSGHITVQDHYLYRWNGQPLSYNTLD